MAVALVLLVVMLVTPGKAPEPERPKEEEYREGVGNPIRERCWTKPCEKQSDDHEHYEEETPNPTEEGTEKRADNEARHGGGNIDDDALGDLVARQAAVLRRKRIEG